MSDKNKTRSEELQRNKKTVVAAVGGDMRLAAAAALFSRRAEVRYFGSELCGEAEEGEMRCITLADAVNGADIVLLGLPCSTDRIKINAPFHPCAIYAEELLACVPDGAIICGGMIPSEISGRHAKCIDYYRDEALQLRNAIPTAEGAIMLAMEETPFTVSGAKAAVLGSGRIAKALAPRLRSLGAEVTVIARKSEDRALWQVLGIRSAGFDDLKKHLAGSDLIFNTVPARVLGRAELAEIKPRAAVIDLASRPGGTDFDAARALGVKVIWALSLPGRVAPVTSGEIIYETLCDLLAAEGVRI